VTVFSNANANVIETGQFFQAINLSVTNIADSASEVLIVDGSQLKLLNSSGSTNNNGLLYTISINNNIANISLTGATLSSNELNSLLNSIQYFNSSNDPTSATKVITLTSIQDNGGTANAGNNTFAANIATSIKVLSIAPTAIVSPILIIDETQPVDTVDDFDNEVIVADIIETQPVIVDEAPQRALPARLSVTEDTIEPESTVNSDTNDRQTEEQPQINLEIAEPDTTNKLPFAISAIIASNTQLASKWSAQSDPLLLIKSNNFLNSLDKANESLARNITIDTINLGSGAVFSTGLSIGYVAWLLRSGIILSSVLSSLPAWRFIDPLPILSSLGDSGASQESLEDIVSEPHTSSETSQNPSDIEDKS
jgi:hypothetical protein